MSGPPIDSASVCQPIPRPLTLHPPVTSTSTCIRTRTRTTSSPTLPGQPTSSLGLLPGPPPPPVPPQPTLSSPFLDPQALSLSCFYGCLCYLLVSLLLSLVTSRRSTSSSLSWLLPTLVLVRIYHFRRDVFPGLQLVVHPVHDNNSPPCHYPYEYTDASEHPGHHHRRCHDHDHDHDCDCDHAQSRPDLSYPPSPDLLRSAARALVPLRTSTVACDSAQASPKLHMATADDQLASTQHDLGRCGSPSPDTVPTPAINACPELSHRASTASFASRTSSATTTTSRNSSMGSDMATPRSRSRPPRHGPEAKRTRRRGYMRPQATDFAASAKSRESVMNLGSIAHLQYYFARTGLLDGKGGQLARKKNKHGATLDMAALEANPDDPNAPNPDADSSYASMGSSPDVGSSEGFANRDALDSLTTDEAYDDDESIAGSEADMLPPTVSTYHHQEKIIPKPPTILELKADLESSLSDAARALDEVRQRKDGTYVEPPNSPSLPNMPAENSQGWYELQGMHILDVSTLAIRAAKMYYTAHELPHRLDAIKSEKQIRADLLAVMDVLRQMATRNFKDGMRQEELDVISGWIDSVFGILRQEEGIEAAEKAEQAGWLWLDGDWTGREMERERAFLVSMDPNGEPIPEWTPLPDGSETPTPFLAAMQNGVRLIKLHNAVVAKSRRRFGAIPKFHTDTQKPYRRADNLRYWVKGAELRFEVLVPFDVMGVVNSAGPDAWKGFEASIAKWCRHVREELAKELGR